MPSEILPFNDPVNKTKTLLDKIEREQEKDRKTLSKLKHLLLKTEAFVSFAAQIK